MLVNSQKDVVMQRREDSWVDLPTICKLRVKQTEDMKLFVLLIITIQANIKIKENGQKYNHHKSIQIENVVINNEAFKLIIKLRWNITFNLRSLSQPVEGKNGNFWESSIWMDCLM